MASDNMLIFIFFIYYYL